MTKPKGHPDVLFVNFHLCNVKFQLLNYSSIHKANAFNEAIMETISSWHHSFHKHPLPLGQTVVVREKTLVSHVLDDKLKHISVY